MCIQNRAAYFIFSFRSEVKYIIHVQVLRIFFMLWVIKEEIFFQEVIFFHRSSLKMHSV